MDDSLLELIDSVYDASVTPDHWPAAMAKTERLIGAFTSHILLCRGGRAEIFATAPGHDDKSFAASYEQHYSKVDPMPAYVMSCRTGDFVTDEDAVPKRQFLNSEFYTDWVRPQGMYTCLYTNAFRRQDRAAYLCLTRERGKQPFSTKEMANAERVLLHIGRAADIHFRLAESAPQFQSMRDGSSLGSQEVICVDVHARILFASPAAELRLRHADGLVEGSAGLMATTENETRRLRRRIAQGWAPGQAAGHSSTLELQRGHGKRAISVTAIPAAALRSRLNLTGAYVALLISDPEQQEPTRAQLMREHYHLTRAEIRVAEMILAGHELRLIAAQLNLSVGTVRNQLKSVFQKTNTHRQSSLVSLLWRLTTLNEVR